MTIKHKLMKMRRSSKSSAVLLNVKMMSKAEIDVFYKKLFLQIILCNIQLMNFFIQRYTKNKNYSLINYIESV